MLTNNCVTSSGKTQFLIVFYIEYVLDSTEEHKKKNFNKRKRKAPPKESKRFAFGETRRETAPGLIKSYKSQPSAEPVPHHS